MSRSKTKHALPALVTCDYCGKTMTTDHTGCTYPYLIAVEPATKKVEVFKRKVDSFVPDKDCFDCGAGPGTLHHFGCDEERCPKCGGQLISCDCWSDKLIFFLNTVPELPAYAKKRYGIE